MTTGMLLGKFLPPHLGHVYLGEFARGYADRLAVVVCSLAREPIPGHLRYQWMRELLPGADVVHLTDELPQEPAEHPDFWALWRASLERVLPYRPDLVFASEGYGAKLAEVLGARFVPVDIARAAVPTSGTAVRRDPLASWDYLPRCVRPYFVKRVSVFGPESTGKSTLAARLAAEFGTCWVPEYARSLLEAKGGALEEADLPAIARGQAASEDALARNARGLLVCDTDPLATAVWGEALYGRRDPVITALAEGRRYDLTLLLDVDVPWVADPVRYLPGERRSFFERCRAALEASGRAYRVVSGTWEARLGQARQAVAAVLAS